MPYKKTLSPEEIEKLQKKGHLCYRPRIDKHGIATASDRKYFVGGDGAWRLPTTRVRQSKKARLKARRAAEKRG